MHAVISLEEYFSPFRRNIIGCEQLFESPFGQKRILYADWTASGRAYGPIETSLQNEILPFFGNTHTETSITGRMMSSAYGQAKAIVREHVNAKKDDVLVFCGSGMTAAVNKLQRIMGLRVSEGVMDYVKYFQPDESVKPLVLVTHMEHHSNHISWLETIATVEMIRPREDGNVDLEHLRELLERFRHRKMKIAAVTACSNVTGIETPVQEIATIMHENDGFCFVDYACSAPYVRIDMHPGSGAADLDAIYFSFHKFLGGPGTPGILIFNSKLYKNRIPDQPGGGTIIYSNPWKAHEYISDIELREDGGTPPILQGIKAGMCVRLKEEMGVARMLDRETEMLRRLFDRFEQIDGVEILGATRKRLGVISFTVKHAHYDLIVKILNDRFGIQARGGCSCAGTYGHVLLGIDKIRSYKILNALRAGEMWCKPGWVRLSIHPTMTDAEIDYMMDAVESTVDQYVEWEKDYAYDPVCSEYTFRKSGKSDLSVYL
ncbi:aminotransferase class V-fold PLP-dependent enzyme [Flavitalea sp. BT771]|uniref:aminotransferase class V-fold PLP-dependent enzyme n=1 Tax=Flavitalea sp. BT771 TaxID=3063329 RepID=UPI0026E34BFE|nr:aminotransferase class V-fold PLP-dependent enzyme [Flavitalea sp. BT771]MDO6433652.1 aminotransferase class V-fold PLP-dependent enzyme [Flavitalea sp. BT771]MDV6222443.1 aminotransferase class V-fold PLP-dependent enzyme [Flavitalea sp. BT771]